MQQPQHGRGAQQADEQQHHTGNGADNGRRVDGLFHVLGVARTVKRATSRLESASGRLTRKICLARGPSVSVFV